jgi:hypothetical protein
MITNYQGVTNDRYPFACTGTGSNSEENSNVRKQAINDSFVCTVLRAILCFTFTCNYHLFHLLKSDDNNNNNREIIEVSSGLEQIIKVLSAPLLYHQHRQIKTDE